MNAIFKKMNFKAQALACILDAPEAFLPAMEEMQELTEIQTEIQSEVIYPFLLGFVLSQAELAVLADRVANALEEDGLFWIAYPKKSSKKYKTDISRDQGWAPIGELGYEPVRMVAIDADWSALRFRKAEHIKSLKRRNSMALSEKGKARTQNNPG